MQLAVIDDLGALPTRADSALLDRIDSVMRSAMKRRGIVGATLAIVRNGGISRARGYGLSDIARHAPVDPRVTEFGVSSISKVFTAIAVLQQVEHGRLSLTDAVADRIPFPLRGVKGRPIRVENLLTHSAGFDEVNVGVGARSPSTVIPLRKYLAASMPPQVRPAGEVASYSNSGFALAGFLVEQVTGVPFATYERDSVLRPLGMTRSEFGQPLPDSLERDRAKPYEADPGPKTEVPRIFFNDAPASALYTTAEDMRRFMTIFLGVSSKATSGALSSRTAHLLSTRQFSHNPALQGLTFGFRERTDKGVHSIEQGGDWEDYSSDLILTPDSGLGLFVAFSGEGFGDVADSVWDVLLNDVRGSSSQLPLPLPVHQVSSSQNLSRFEGVYRDTRYSHHSLSRLGVLTGAIAEYSVQGGASSSEMSAFGTRLLPIGPALFRRSDTGELVAFRDSADDSGDYMFRDSNPYSAYERVPWYDGRQLHVELFALSLLMFVIGLLVFGLKWRSSRWPAQSVFLALRRVTLGLDVVALLFLVGCAAALGAIDIWEYQYGLPALMKGVLWLSVPLALLALAAALMTVAVWVRREGRPVERWLVTLHTLVGIQFVILVAHWNLLPSW